jgi:hypothetical protein
MFQLFSLVMIATLASLIIFALLWFLRDIARSLFSVPVCDLHGEPMCACVSLSAPFSSASDRVVRESIDTSPVGVSWH